MRTVLYVKPTSDLNKAFIQAYSYRNKKGNTINVAAHYDKRIKKAAQHAPDHSHDVSHLSAEDKAKFGNMHKEQHVTHYYEAHALGRKLDANKQLLVNLERSAAHYDSIGDKKNATLTRNKIIKLKQVIMRHDKMHGRAKAIVEGIGQMKEGFVKGSGKLTDDADKAHAHYVGKLGARFSDKPVNVKSNQAQKLTQTRKDYYSGVNRGQKQLDYDLKIDRAGNGPTFRYTPFEALGVKYFAIEHDGQGWKGGKTYSVKDQAGHVVQTLTKGKDNIGIAHAAKSRKDLIERFKSRTEDGWIPVDAYYRETENKSTTNPSENPNSSDETPKTWDEKYSFTSNNGSTFTLEHGTTSRDVNLKRSIGKYGSKLTDNNLKTIVSLARSARSFCKMDSRDSTLEILEPDAMSIKNANGYAKGYEKNGKFMGKISLNAKFLSENINSDAGLRQIAHLIAHETAHTWQFTDPNFKLTHLNKKWGSRPHEQQADRIGDYAYKGMVDDLIGQGLLNNNNDEPVTVRQAGESKGFAIPPKPDDSPKDGDRNAEGLVFHDGRWHREDADQKRFDIGKKLSKEERRQVMNTLTDVYKAKDAEKETRINGNGDEYAAYPYQPELFERSDITGAMLRHYVTLPDGKIAHPTEIFPDVTKSQIDAIFAEQQHKEEIAKRETDKIMSKQFDSVKDAGRFFDEKSDNSISPITGKPTIFGSLDRIAYEKDGKIVMPTETQANDERITNELKNRGWKKYSSKPQPEIIEHETRKGKVIRGIVRKDLTYAQAKAIDEYTFKKDGGFFIREKHLEASNKLDAAKDNGTITPEQHTVAKQALATGTPADAANALREQKQNIDELKAVYLPQAQQDTGPHDGEIDENGLVFRNGRWHRDDKEQVNDNTPVASADEYHYSQAQSAYQHSSRSGAAAAREEYVRSINSAYEKLNNGLNEEQKKFLDDAFIQLKKDYLEKEKPVLSTRSGMVSAHIAGRSNFNSSLATRGQSANDKATSDHSRWFEGAISDIESGISKRRDETQKTNDANSAKAKKVNTAIKNFAGEIGAMRTPGMDKSAFVKGATKSWQALVDLGKDVALDAYNKINAALVKDGSNLESVLGKRSNLWKDISGFLQAQNIDKKDQALQAAIDHLEEDSKQSDLPAKEQAEDKKLVDTLKEAVGDKPAKKATKSQARDLIDSMRWTLNDLKGHTPKEFENADVESRLQPKIDKINAMLASGIMKNDEGLEGTLSRVAEEANGMIEKRKAQTNTQATPSAASPKKSESELNKKPASNDDELNPNSPNYRYRDTGNVAGSRKEQAAMRIKMAGKNGERLNATDIDWQEIEQNPREAQTLITKANLFGAVDWNALKATDMEPGAGFLIDKVYRSIAKEAGNSEQERKDYALGLQTIRDRMEQCKTPDDVMKTLSEISDEFYGKIKSESGENAINTLSPVWASLGKNFVGLIKRGYSSRQFSNYKSGNKAFLIHALDTKTGKVKDWSWAEKDPRTGSGQSTPREKPFQLLVADSITRKGGKPINVFSTQGLKDLVGLRDVQSGNWVLKDKDSAIFHVQKCAEAFSDLSDILGIPLSKIALNGRLAMAFGARGHGTALAHYEPIQRIINLTKLKGGGSLAHEWLHSLDNVIAELEGGKAGTVNHYVSEDPDLLPNGKVKDAVIKLRKAMTEGNVPKKEPIAYTASDFRTAKYNFDKATSGLQLAIKNAGSLDKAIDAVNDRFKSSLNSKNVKDWRKLAAAYYDNNPEGGRTLVATGEKHSFFANGALNLDKGKDGKYWSKPREMAARAFEAYVTDKLASEGRENTYLSAHADNNDYKTMGAYEPYPQGQDRANINAAYDELFAALRESGTLQKAFSMNLHNRPKRVVLLRKAA